MKKMLSLLMMMFSISLFGCTTGADSGLDEAVNNLSLEYLSQIKEDINLPVDGLNNAEISWESSNTNVINNDGLVTRPLMGEEDEVVTLTATITLGELEDTKAFEMTVKADETVVEEGIYNQKEEVAEYLQVFEKLPSNYVKKDHFNKYDWTEANKLSAGGDDFGNREGYLPDASGRQYYELDIDYHGGGNRNSYRIVYSNDGLIFYTHDHYDSFIKWNGTEFDESVVYSEDN